MNAERLKRLERILESGDYWINVEEVAIYSRHTGKPMKAHDNTHRYFKVNLTYEGRQYSYAVHELIAYAGGLNLLDMSVNHKDCNTYNNRLENLEVMTMIENVMHGWEHKRYRNNGCKRTIPDRVVRKIQKDYNAGFTNKTELAKKHGVSRKFIYIALDRVTV